MFPPLTSSSPSSSRPELTRLPNSFPANASVQGTPSGDTEMSSLQSLRRPSSLGSPSVAEIFTWSTTRHFSHVGLMRHSSGLASPSQSVSSPQMSFLEWRRETSVSASSRIAPPSPSDGGVEVEFSEVDLEEQREEIPESMPTGDQDGELEMVTIVVSERAGDPQNAVGPVRQAPLLALEVDCSGGVLQFKEIHNTIRLRWAVQADHQQIVQLLTRHGRASERERFLQAIHTLSAAKEARDRFLANSAVDDGTNGSVNAVSSRTVLMTAQAHAESLMALDEEIERCEDNLEFCKNELLGPEVKLLHAMDRVEFHTEQYRLSRLVTQSTALPVASTLASDVLTVAGVLTPFTGATIKVVGVLICLTSVVVGRRRWQEYKIAKGKVETARSWIDRPNLHPLFTAVASAVQLGQNVVQKRNRVLQMGVTAIITCADSIDVLGGVAKAGELVAAMNPLTWTLAGVGGILGLGLYARNWWKARIAAQERTQLLEALRGEGELYTSIFNKEYEQLRSLVEISEDLEALPSPLRAAKERVDAATMDQVEKESLALEQLIVTVATEQTQLKISLRLVDYDPIFACRCLLDQLRVEGNPQGTVASFLRDFGVTDEKIGILMRAGTNALFLDPQETETARHIPPAQLEEYREQEVNAISHLIFILNLDKALADPQTLRKYLGFEPA